MLWEIKKDAAPCRNKKVKVWIIFSNFYLLPLYLFFNLLSRKFLIIIWTYIVILKTILWIYFPTPLINWVCPSPCSKAVFVRSTVLPYEELTNVVDFFVSIDWFYLIEIASLRPCPPILDEITIKRKGSP